MSSAIADVCSCFARAFDVRFSYLEVSASFFRRGCHRNPSNFATPKRWVDERPWERGCVRERNNLYVPLRWLFHSISPGDTFFSPYVKNSDG